MKASRLVTKIVVRVFFVLVFFALVPVFMGDQQKFKDVNLTFRHKWETVFPLILITCFIGLLLTAAYRKFNDLEINWLLVLNTIILTVYGAALFYKVAHMMGSF
jgi:hypothetical protein